MQKQVLDPAGTGAALGQDDVRQRNRELVLTLLARNGHLNRAQLASASGLARPSVSRIVSELLTSGWVQESEPNSSGNRGRPHTSVALREGHSLIHGVDLRLDGILIQARDLAGTVLGQTRHALHRAAPADHAITTLADQIVEDARRFGRPSAGVGVAIGATPDQTHRVVRHSPYLPWRDIPLARRLGERIQAALGGEPAQVVIYDVTTCAALANWRELSTDRGLTSLAHLQMGIGAGATVVDLRLGRPESIHPTRIAHVPVQQGGPRCACGARGCFDAVAGFPALVRAAQATGLRAGRGPDAVDRFCARLRGAAEAGSRPALDAITSMADVFARAAASLINVTQPSRFTYGGYPLLLGPPFQQRFLAGLTPYLSDEQRDGEGLLRSTELGDAASVTGAFLLAQQAVLSASTNRETALP